MSIQPTPHLEVNLVLTALLTDVQAILGNQFVGLYLYGSLAYGGFDRDSDVDYVVVMKDELAGGHLAALQEMHTRFASLNSWCATQLEGSYLPRRALRSYDPRRALYFHIDRGRGEVLKRMQIDDPRLSRAWWGGWVFLRAVLWEHGIRLAGPPARNLLDPVQPGELRQAALATLEGWLEPLLEEIGELGLPGYQPYCVLTVCRLLYTLEKDAIASKQVAARWARARLEPRWDALIARAWTGRHHPEDSVSPEEIEATRDFIRLTLERFHKSLPESSEKEKGK
jgi:hypothetical protein